MLVLSRWCLAPIALLAGSVTARANPTDVETASGDSVLPWVAVQDIAPGPTESLGGQFFRLKLPTEIDTPAWVRQGGKIWVYAGQEVFAHTSVCVGPRSYREWISTGMPVATLRDQLVGTELIDVLGRVWILNDIDPALNDDATDQDTILDTGNVTTSDTSTYGDGYWEQGTEVLLHGYDLSDCSGNEEEDLFIHGTDDRSIVANPMNVRERKIGILVISLGGGLQTHCSGVFVDQNTLLTAAHCTTDQETGLPLPTTSFDVCTWGNYQTGAECWQSPWVIRAPNYYGGALKNDYALVDIGDNQNAGVGWMAISTASGSVIETVPNRTVGHPRWGSGCASNLVLGVNPFLRACLGFTQLTDVELTPNLIKTTGDASVGQSGSPLFYYPQGCCGAHYVTGVLSTYRNPFGTHAYVGGPNHDRIRQWVNDNK